MGEREEKDPREQHTPGWEYTVPLFEIRLKNVSTGVRALAGTDFPGASRKHRFAVQVEFPELPSTLEGRRVMRQVFRGMLAALEENRSWEAASRLGGEDAVGNLPLSRPAPDEAHCFWMKKLEYTKPVLAFRTNFKRKDDLKAAFDRIWRASAYPEELSRSGWDKEAKVWWMAADHGYPRLLGLLRQAAFRLKWIRREGFPPPPPIAEEGL